MNPVRFIARKARGARRLAHMTALQMMTPADRITLKHVRLPEFSLIIKANEIVGRVIQAHGAFEAAETAFFQSIVRDTDIIFDVGGNVGYFSMLFAARARRGEVHVFEPIPLNASLIKASADLNGFSQITVNRCAVGDERKDVAFSVSMDSAYSSMIDTGRSAEAASISVPMETIDAYVAAHDIPRVDLMKVDVEGAEHLVIDGASGLLRDPARRPRLVMLELAEANLTPFGTSVERIIEAMQRFGYQPSQLSSAGRLTPYRTDLKHGYNVFFSAGSI